MLYNILLEYVNRLSYPPKEIIRKYTHSTNKTIGLLYLEVSDSIF